MSLWICSLGNGDGAARLEYPRPLDGDQEDDLIEWLDLVLTILKKRREKLRELSALTAAEPKL